MQFRHSLDSPIDRNTSELRFASHEPSSPTLSSNKDSPFPAFPGPEQPPSLFVQEAQDQPFPLVRSSIGERRKKPASHQINDVKQDASSIAYRRQEKCSSSFETSHPDADGKRRKSVTWRICQRKRRRKLPPDLIAIRWRVLLLTIYCCLQYFLLTVGFWDSEIFHEPPSPPSASLLLLPNRTSELHVKMDSFISMVHPHVDAHPHLHCPLSIAMQRCLGMAAAEWILLLWISSLMYDKRRSNLFGLLVTVLFFMNSSGTYSGGLEYKTPLFPDSWGYIFSRFNLNFLQKNCPLLNHTFWYSNILSQCLDPFPVANVSEATQTLMLFSFLVIYVMDLLGAVMSMIAMYRFLRIKTLIYPTSVLAIALLVSSHFLSSLPPPDARDGHWIDFRDYKGREFMYPSSSNPPVYLTKYVKMSDGVELAADIYLPPSIVSSFVSKIESPIFRQQYISKLGLRPQRETPTDISRIPTLLIMTRYNRRMTVRWPFTLLSMWGQPRGSSTTNVWSPQFVDALVTNGYAVVVVDTRGTGASFGTRPIDFAPAEVRDFQEICKFVRAQFWSNGRVSAGGFSYDGMTGLQLASQEKLDAVIALFTPIDVVHDLIQPGGVVCSSFVEDYTGLTTAFEKQGSPLRHMLLDFAYDWQLILGFLFVFGIAAPVKSRETSLPLAITVHQANWNMSAMVEELHFSDDFVLLPTPDKSFERMVVKDFGITRAVVEDIVKSQAAVYIVGGYCDSSSVRGSSRLYEALHEGHEGDKHQLIIGPWTHTGRRNCSPYSGGTFPQFEFDMYWDILRFLDCQVKDRCWGPQQASNSTVHFWSVGEERWIASSEFPPLEVKEMNLHLSSIADDDRAIGGSQRNNSYKLVQGEASNFFLTHLQSVGKPPIRYQVDYEATTRGLSRWVVAKHPFRMASSPNRQLSPTSSLSYSGPQFKLSMGNFINLPFWSSSADSSTGDLLLFTSFPLVRPLRTVGSPLLRFSLNLTLEFDRRAKELKREVFRGPPKIKVNRLALAPALDVTVFGYLEDVDNSSGEVHYVTEGRVLLSHRPTLARCNSHLKTFSGLDNWEGCVVPPSIESQRSGLRQTSRLGSADAVYQDGDQQSHQFSVGGVECVVFTFEPVAWTFQPGHSIRLSLAGADRANFHWSKTQIKEDADFLTLSLLSKIGSTDRLRELQQRPLNVERPHVWELDSGFLKLPVLE